MVRLPCGSMSTQRTRCPFSAKATATFKVVVVLATPPFWLAKAMTLACPITEGSDVRGGNPLASRYSQPPALILLGYTLPVRMADRLDKRLIFVTGKGGVGKSTVSAALGLAAARSGRRTIVAELSYQDRIAKAFGGEDSHFTEVEIGDRLWTISIDPQHALEEYLRIQIRVKPMADLLSGSKMFQYFAVATPGMSELVTMGKVWELVQPERRTKGASAYDLVIVDSPATGHGVGMLTSPRTFADIARVGPIANQGRAIYATVTDRRHTGVVAVALPEEM